MVSTKPSWFIVRVRGATCRIWKWPPLAGSIGSTTGVYLVPSETSRQRRLNRTSMHSTTCSIWSRKMKLQVSGKTGSIQTVINIYSMVWLVRGVVLFLLYRFAFIRNRDQRVPCVRSTNFSHTASQGKILLRAAHWLAFRFGAVTTASKAQSRSSLGT